VAQENIVYEGMRGKFFSLCFHPPPFLELRRYVARHRLHVGRDEKVEPIDMNISYGGKDKDYVKDARGEERKRKREMLKSY
jgi:hypothetical protein